MKNSLEIEDVLNKKQFTWGKTYRILPDTPYEDRIFNSIEEAEKNIGLDETDYYNGKPLHAGYIIYDCSKNPVIVKIIKGNLDNQGLAKDYIQHIKNPFHKKGVIK